MKLEMIWLLVPLTGIASQLGGSDNIPKAVRRIGIPLLMALAVTVFKGWSWWIIPMILTQWGSFCLPFTLIGDGVPKHPLNWVWVPLWGILICISPLWLHPNVWLATGLLGVFLGILGILSNIKATARYFQWKLVEFAIGAFPAISLCYAITL
jgi:hypothetical protein